MSDNLPAIQDENSGVPALAIEHPIASRVVKMLGRKTPKTSRKSRPGPGGRRFTYAPWAYTAQVLNRAFGPTWSYEFAQPPDWRQLPPLERKKDGKVTKVEREEVMLIMRLRTPWGVQEAAGDAVYYPSNPEQSRGAVIQSAQSVALRRAAARWGVALDLYFDVDEDQFEREAEEQKAKRAFSDAVGEIGLTPMTAVSKLSKALTDDDSALETVDDCLAATGKEGAAAYYALVEALRR